MYTLYLALSGALKCLLNECVNEKTKNRVEQVTYLRAPLNRQGEGNWRNNEAAQCVTGAGSVVRGWVRGKVSLNKEHLR